MADNVIPLPASDGGAGSQVIDTHVHSLPEPLLRDVAGRDDGASGVAARRTEDGWLVTVEGAAPKLVRPPMTDAGRRAAIAAKQGVTAQLVSPWLDAQPTAAMSEGQARDWSRRLNEALGEQQDGSGVLVTVPLTAHAPADLALAAGQGAAGLILSTSPPGAGDLADPVLEPLWEAAAGLAVPVVLHPPTEGPSRVLPGAAEFGNTFCRLVDSTFAVTKLLLSGVLDRHPALRLVVVHGGGFLPYQSLRLDGGHRADALAHYDIERDHPSDYLTDLYFDTVAMKPAAIRFLAESVGPGRVLLGSDYPFPLGDPAPVETVRAAGLGDAATAAVLGGNAGRLFPSVSVLEGSHA
jgi:aminocarboxymuconate-semialdehyde decarboxylase